MSDQIELRAELREARRDLAREANARYVLSVENDRLRKELAETRSVNEQLREVEWMYKRFCK